MGPGEQSIEDILASIKRAIVDEVPRDAPPRAAEDDEEDVLELTRPVEAAPPPPAARAALVSEDAASASRQALGYLSTLKLKGGEPADDTLHGLVRELLRPMLKAWLDAELPAIVERLVVQEIARLTAGRD